MRLFSKNFEILVGVVPAWIVPVWIGQDRFCGLRSWQSTSSVGFLFGHKILSDSWGAFSNHKLCNDQLFIAFISMRKLSYNDRMAKEVFRVIDVEEEWKEIALSI